MKLYTSTGDDGSTSLVDGRRVGKDDPLVAVFGKVDELNCLLGWCRAAAGSAGLAERLEAVQRELFTVGAELAAPADARQSLGLAVIGSEHYRRLETWIDQAMETLAPLANFVLPGGTERACRLHLARTCCRALERAVVALARSAPLRPEVVIYLNRLGDLLFAWSLLANHEANLPEHIWKARP